MSCNDYAIFLTKSYFHHHATSSLHLADARARVNGVLSVKPPTLCIISSSLCMGTSEKLLAHALTLLCGRLG